MLVSLDGHGDGPASEAAAPPSSADADAGALGAVPSPVEVAGEGLSAPDAAAGVPLVSVLEAGARPLGLEEHAVNARSNGARRTRARLIGVEELCYPGPRLPSDVDQRVLRQIDAHVLKRWFLALPTTEASASSTACAAGSGDEGQEAARPATRFRYSPSAPAGCAPTRPARARGFRVRASPTTAQRESRARTPPGSRRRRQAWSGSASRRGEWPRGRSRCSRSR